MKTRRQLAQNLRDDASQTAFNREHPKHVSNGEEYRYRRVLEKDCGGGVPRLIDAGPTHLTNFSKGLPHAADGSLLDANHYSTFVLGIQSGDPQDFERTPLGPVRLEPAPAGPLKSQISRDACGRVSLLTEEQTSGCPDRKDFWYSQAAKEANNGGGALVRAWESAGAGMVFDLQGPDAQAVTMPPAPKLDSRELAAEMSEVYAMALLRDTHFKHFRTAGGRVGDTVGHLNGCTLSSSYSVDQAVAALQPFADEVARLENLSPQTIFRGLSPEDKLGPYISQFMLIGNSGINASDDIYNISSGFAAYGAIHANQRVRVAEPCKDYLTTYEAWLDVQNAADLRASETYQSKPEHRFITTPRDLATYVHYDALYEAYLNACLIMLSMGIPFDRGIPFQAADNVDKQQGFAHFGGPHILSLVTEVATRALKAVRYQKFNIHRRARPEALGGLVDAYMSQGNAEFGSYLGPVAPLVAALDPALLAEIAAHNAQQNGAYPDRSADASGSAARHLLPMAFPEGSPMHPSYGAGHATVAGACVTILKAYFDHAAILKLGHSAECGYHIATKADKFIAYEANPDGTALEEIELEQPLSVEGELNKLAANISIGRNWAGVHYHSDYVESLCLGEQIALGILEEQKLTYSENFTMTVPLFKGGTVRI